MLGALQESLYATQNLIVIRAWIATGGIFDQVRGFKR
jgi:hypothetical protein